MHWMPEQLHRSHSYFSCVPPSQISRNRADRNTINRTSRDENLAWCRSCVLSVQLVTQLTTSRMIVSMMYSIKTRKIRRNKIRLHNWSVKEHQERGSDLISLGYVSRLSSQLEMRSEGHCFLHFFSLMWKFQDVKFIHKICVLLCSVRCLVPSERKAPLAPNHETQSQ